MTASNIVTLALIAFVVVLGAVRIRQIVGEADDDSTPTDPGEDL